MKKYLISGIAIFIATKSVYAIDNNKICFNNAIESFNLIDYSVTESIPFDENITLSNNNKCLNIEAGRKADSSNVSWVKNRMESSGITWIHSNMVHSGVSFSMTPSKLNFAINLDITFLTNSNTYTCKNLYLGQGSSFLQGKNWWLFLNTNNGNYTLNCVDINNNLVTVKAEGGTTDTSFSINFNN